LMLGDVLSKRGRFQAPGRGVEPTMPHVVVVVDEGGVDTSARLGVHGGLAGVTLLEVAGGATTSDPAVLSLGLSGDGRLQRSTMEGLEELGRADRMGQDEAESLARRLAPLRLSSASVSEKAPLSTDKNLTELLGIGDVTQAALWALWAPRSPLEL